MMTRVILFRTFIAVSLSAGVVSTGIILWRLAPGGDHAGERETSLAALTAPLEALPERLPPVRLEPPGETDAGWRLSQLPPIERAYTESTGAIENDQEAEAVINAPAQPAIARPPVSVRVIPIAPSGSAGVAAQARESVAAVAPPPQTPPAPTVPSRSLEPSPSTAVAPPPVSAEPRDAAAAAVPALDASVSAPVLADIRRPQPEAPRAVEPQQAEARVASAQTGVGDGLVDLNRGSLEQLNSLKGGGRIGRAIIQARPYSSVEDLLRKKVLSRSTFDKIRDQVTVR